ncbi:MAG: hypothetical protein R3C43_15450 [Chloroflexota bacterium]
MDDPTHYTLLSTGLTHVRVALVGEAVAVDWQGGAGFLSGGQERPIAEKPCI